MASIQELIDNGHVNPIDIQHEEILQKLDIFFNIGCLYTYRNLPFFLEVLNSGNLSTLLLSDIQALYTETSQLENGIYLPEPTKLALFRIFLSVDFQIRNIENFSEMSYFEIRRASYQIYRHNVEARIRQMRGNPNGQYPIELDPIYTAFEETLFINEFNEGIYDNGPSNSLSYTVNLSYTIPAPLFKGIIDLINFNTNNFLFGRGFAPYDQDEIKYYIAKNIFREDIFNILSIGRVDDFYNLYVDSLSLIETNELDNSTFFKNRVELLLHSKCRERNWSINTHLDYYYYFNYCIFSKHQILVFYEREIRNFIMNSPDDARVSERDLGLDSLIEAIRVRPGGLGIQQNREGSQAVTLNAENILNSSGLPYTLRDLDMYYKGCYVRFLTSNKKTDSSYHVGAIDGFDRGEHNIPFVLLKHKNKRYSLPFFDVDWVKREAYLSSELDLSIPSCGYKNIEDTVIRLVKSTALADQRKKSYYKANYQIQPIVVTDLYRNSGINGLDYLWGEYPTYREALDLILSKKQKCIALDNKHLILVSMGTKKILLYRDEVPIGFYIFKTQTFKLYDENINVKPLKKLGISYD